MYEWTNLARPLTTGATFVKFDRDLPDFAPGAILRVCMTGEALLLREKHKDGSWRVERAFGSIGRRGALESEILHVGSTFLVEA